MVGMGKEMKEAFMRKPKAFKTIESSNVNLNKIQLSLKISNPPKINQNQITFLKMIHIDFFLFIQ